MSFNLFIVRLCLKRLINNVFSAKNTDVRLLAKSQDNTIYKDVDFIINSSVIIRFEKDGREFFFRECKKHSSLREHINNSIEDYCENITNYNDRVYLLNTIKKDLSDKKNYKKYLKIPLLYDTDLMCILSGMYNNYSYVGLPSFAVINNQVEFLRFLQYSCCVLAIHSSNNYVKYGHLENSNANKQVSTYILSCLLGVDNLIPKVDLCELNIGGKVRIGTLMEKAEGKNVAYIPPDNRTLINKKTFLRDITNLEYLDALCYQLDHRLDNYNVVYDENGNANTVVAFDNDASRTFFPFPSLPKQTYAGASCVVKDNSINRPYIDKQLSQHICSISKKELDEKLSHYLTWFQRKALWKRICILKKAIEKQRGKERTFEVEGDEWSYVDDNKELDPKYGKTYYYLYRYDTTMIDREIDFEKRRQCI